MVATTIVGGSAWKLQELNKLLHIYHIKSSYHTHTVSDCLKRKRGKQNKITSQAKVSTQKEKEEEEE